MFKQRSPLRLCEGWHRIEGWRGSYKRDLMGHHLIIFHGRTPNDPNWYKWVDGHFRGSANKLSTAKLQLELEAVGGGTAWANKLGKLATNVTAENTMHLTVGCLLIGKSTLCMRANVVNPSAFTEELSSGQLTEALGIVAVLPEKREASSDGVGAV